MRVLIVSQYYWPEDFGAGMLVPRLAEMLQHFGHQVTVLTGMPNYPGGHVFLQYRWSLFQMEEHNGVKLIRGRFYTSSRTSGAFRRGSSALSFALSSILLSLATRKPEVVLTFSPPVFMGLAGLVISHRWGVPWILNVKDLFTESIIAAGLAKTGMATRLLYRLERSIYHSANQIITNSPVFKEYLMNTAIPERRITVIPDWADGEFIRPLPPENRLRENWGLRGYFVVLYSGSMGYSSSLETVLSAAKELKDLSNVRFVLVGDGVKRRVLERIAKKNQLSNVQFHQLQPLSRLPEVLGVADVGLVTLSRQAGKVSTQGKVYSLMAAGRPIVAVVPEDTDAGRIVNEGKFGWQINPEDPTSLSQLIREFITNPRKVIVYGRRARDIFEKTYSLEVCARRFEETLISLSRCTNA